MIVGFERVRVTACLLLYGALATTALVEVTQPSKPTECWQGEWEATSQHASEPWSMRFEYERAWGKLVESDGTTSGAPASKSTSSTKKHYMKQNETRSCLAEGAVVFGGLGFFGKEPSQPPLPSSDIAYAKPSPQDIQYFANLSVWYRSTGSCEHKSLISWNNRTAGDHKGPELMQERGTLFVQRQELDIKMVKSGTGRQEKVVKGKGAFPPPLIGHSFHRLPSAAFLGSRKDTNLVYTYDKVALKHEDHIIFDATRVGEMGAAQTVTVSQKNSSVSIDSFVQLSVEGADRDSFTVFPMGFTVKAKGTHTFNITFVPKRTTPTLQFLRARLVIRSSETRQTRSVLLYGIGLDNVLNINVDVKSTIVGGFRRSTFGYFVIHTGNASALTHTGGIMVQMAPGSSAQISITYGPACPPVAAAGAKGKAAATGKAAAKAKPVAKAKPAAFLSEQEDTGILVRSGSGSGKIIKSLQSTKLQVCSVGKALHKITITRVNFTSSKDTFPAEIAHNANNITKMGGAEKLLAGRKTEYWFTVCSSASSCTGKAPGPEASGDRVAGSGAKAKPKVKATLLEVGQRVGAADADEWFFHTQAAEDTANSKDSGNGRDSDVTSPKPLTQESSNGTEVKQLAGAAEQGPFRFADATGNSSNYTNHTGAGHIKGATVSERSLQDREDTYRVQSYVLFGGYSGRGLQSITNKLYLLHLHPPKKLRQHVKADSLTELRDFFQKCRKKTGSDPKDLKWDVRWEVPVLRGALPPPRYGHVSQQVGPLLFVFGGMGRAGHLSDLWVLDLRVVHEQSVAGASGSSAASSLSSWTEVGPEGVSPSARMDAQSSLLTTKGGQVYIVIFGGVSMMGVMEDVHMLNTGCVQLGHYSNTSCKLVPPPGTPPATAASAGTSKYLSMAWVPVNVSTSLLQRPGPLSSGVGIRYGDPAAASDSVLFLPGFGQASWLNRTKELHYDETYVNRSMKPDRSAGIKWQETERLTPRTTRLTLLKTLHAVKLQCPGPLVNSSSPQPVLVDTPFTNKVLSCAWTPYKPPQPVLKQADAMRNVSSPKTVKPPAASQSLWSSTFTKADPLKRSSFACFVSGDGRVVVSGGVVRSMSETFYDENARPECERHRRESDLSKQCIKKHTESLRQKPKKPKPRRSYMYSMLTDTFLQFDIGLQQTKVSTLDVDASANASVVSQKKPQAV